MLDRIFLLAFLTVSLCSCSSSSTSGGDWVGRMAPATRVQMVSGEFLPLEEFRGKTVVLTFWATWCSHSSQLLSDLGAAAAKFQNRPDIMFLNVSVDKADDLEKVKTRLRDAALTSTKNAFSGNAEYDEAFISFRCTDLPQVYILDPAGVVLAAGDSISVVEEHVK